MKLLLDACVWGGARQALAAAGLDVIWVGDWERDPGDELVLAFARADQRVLVTLDKDFGELTIVRGLPHAGIIRLVGFAAREQAQVCLALVQRFEAELTGGGLITADPRRVRIRSGTDETR